MDQPKLVVNWWGPLFFELKHVPKRQTWSFQTQPTAWWHKRLDQMMPSSRWSCRCGWRWSKDSALHSCLQPDQGGGVRCGIWVQGKVVLLHPAASGMMWSQLAGRQLESMIPMRSSRSGQAEWYDDHPSSHLAVHKVWGDSLRWRWTWYRRQLQRKWYKACWFDLLMEQGRSCSDLFMQILFPPRFLTQDDTQKNLTQLTKDNFYVTADNLTHRRWLHSMDDLFDQGQVFNIYSK